MPSLTVTREIAASRGHVWACLTEPETLEAWFWPPSLAAQVAADVRGTLLTVLHEGFSTESERDEHVQGWSDCLDRLPTGPLE